MKPINSWFTLVEIMLGILIFSFVILWWFQALTAVTLWKAKLIESTNITKDVTYFSERLFEEIKKWGTIDFEEYFNRKMVGTWTLSGSYSTPSGFWNFWIWGNPGTSTYWNEFYYCWTGTTTWGCITPWPQRYGEYAFQFINYWEDSNNDGNIRWDDDDEHLGEGPTVFDVWSDVKEIYLISWDRRKRTLFRWSWKQDPSSNKPSSATCSTTTFWSGCLGTIEMLKLSGKDIWFDHNATTWSGIYDGIIDTWMIDESYGVGTWTIAWSDDQSYWQPLFPDTMSVSDFRVYVYPNINTKYAWKDRSASSNINPYLRLSITLEPSWQSRVTMKGKVPKYTINTTINLTDYFSQ